MIQNYLPEKQRKRKKRRAFYYLIAAVILISVVIGGGLWLTVHTPFLSIQHVEVKGNTTVDSSSIVALLDASVLNPGNEMNAGHEFTKSLLGINNLLIWPSTLPASTTAVIPQLATIAISKSYFSRTVTATVTERKPAGIWCYMPNMDGAGNPLGNETCYWFDANGYLFEKSFDTAGSSLAAVHDYSDAPRGLGQLILPDIFVDNMLSILNTIQKSGVEVKEIALKDIGLQEIDVTTYNGPDLYFSLRFSADEDLPVLQSLMTKGFDNLQYVDFRVQNRAFYK